MIVLWNQIFFFVRMDPRIYKTREMMYWISHASDTKLDDAKDKPTPIPI